MAEGDKTQRLAQTEVLFTADYFDYMAEQARRYEGEIVNSDWPNENIFVFKKVIGVTTGHFTVELPFLPHCPQGCTGTGDRQYHRDQTE